MSCCGNRRRQMMQPNIAGAPPAPAPVYTGAVVNRMAFFVYEGQRTFTITGRATGRRYRFDTPGVKVAVDPRDVPFLRAVADIRRVE